MTGRPEALTGVTPPTPLRELSDVLGVLVVDVVRHDDPKHNGRRTWHVWLGYADYPRYGPIAFRTSDFQRPRRLSGRLRWYGRSAELPELTNEDGRRALRLMHEHVESTTTNPTTRSSPR